MLSLEQIRSLESKVTKAVTLLASFQEENKILKSRLAQYETRIEELEFMIEEFKEEQGEIEQGIISALEHLDTLENAVGGLAQPAAAVPRPSAPPVASAPAAPQPAMAESTPAPIAPEPEFAVEPASTVESPEDEAGFKNENQQLDIF